MGVIDDIASALDLTDVAAARTHELVVFGLIISTLELARALTDRDLSINSSPAVWRTPWRCSRTARTMPATRQDPWRAVAAS
jgi:hypothetical protein